MNPSFRQIVINLLDNPNGIAEESYNELLAFATRNYPEQCDDIWERTEIGETPIGTFVWLNEDDAEELRKKS